MGAYLAAQFRAFERTDFYQVGRSSDSPCRLIETDPPRSDSPTLVLLEITVDSLRDAALSVADATLAHCLPRRLSHSLGVARRLEVYRRLAGPDWSVLQAAGILHDVGYAPTLAKSGFHPLDGATYLAEIGISDRVCALVAHHSCAYREAELRGLSHALVKWEDECTHVRDALWWADMTTSPDGDLVVFEDRVFEIQERYGPEDLVTFFIRQAKPELQAAVERTERRLRDAGISYE